MSDLKDLEQKFHGAMLQLYEDAKRFCNYNATYFLQMVSSQGGLKAAQKLLASPEPAEGFTTLWLCDRLDLSVEAHVLRPEFAPLFSEAECTIARQRLAQYEKSSKT